MDSPVECGAGWGLVGNLTPVLELPRFEPRGSNLPDIENSFLASPFPPLPGVMLSPMSRHYCPSAGARMGIQVWVCLGPKQVQILAGTLPEIAIRMINMGFFNIMDLPLVTAGARRPEGTPPGASFFLFAPTLGARLIFPHRGK